MTQRLKLAVIGAGAMGRDHIRYIQDNPDAKLVAIADPMPESEKLAKSIDVDGMRTTMTCSIMWRLTAW